MPAEAVDGPASRDALTDAEVYRNQYQFLVHINQIYNQRPPIFATIIGGLWYVAADSMKKDTTISTGIFVFSALVCLFFLTMMIRLRDSIRVYMKSIAKFEGSKAVTIPAPRIMHTSTALNMLMVMAFLISVLGAAYSKIQGRSSGPGLTVELKLGN